MSALPHLTLNTIKFISGEFEKKLDGYSVKTYNIDSLTKILIVEDSLIYYIGIIENQYGIGLNYKETFYLYQGKETPYIKIPSPGEKYYTLHIEELSYNSLGFQYNHAQFIRDMRQMTGIRYLMVNYNKFRGYTRRPFEEDEETLLEKVDRIAPEIKLKERYDLWEGVRYYFVIMEFEDINGDIEYAVAPTTRKPHDYITSKGREWIKKGFLYGGTNDEIHVRQDPGKKSMVFLLDGGLATPLTHGKE